MAWRSAFLAAGAWLALVVSAVPAQEDLNNLQETAIKAAARQVAPCVVQINTLGGTDRVVAGPRGTQIRKAIGPTTGVIVDPDGYVISSAFNFINQPKTILVGVAGQKKPFPAKVVATDSSRMLTLLKIDAKGLPVPTAAPKKDLKVGQWSVALGRTLDPTVSEVPSISVGIISALNRVWGKAVQTDAKVSPVNYGGPLIDVQGRVIGILVPASPQGDDSTAGIEWYDSGIGFAIPLEDIHRVLPRLKKGENLKKGLLGIRLKSQDIYGAVPVVGAVTPESAAAKAGIQPGDTILAVDGKPVVRMAQILHLIGPKYEGDTISVTVKRGDKEIKLKDLKLVGAVAAVSQSFLGILPLRDDPELGVQVRYVFPKSPADKAGLKEGDRILKIGGATGNLTALNGQQSGRDQLMALLNQVPPGTQVRLEVLRKGGKTETLKVQLASLAEAASTEIPETLPEAASAKKARAPRVTLDPKTGKPVKPAVAKEKEKKDEKRPETGLLKRLNASGEHTYYLYVDDDYDPNIAHAVVVWLHPPGKFKKDDIELLRDTWSDPNEDVCHDKHVILICPITENRRGWLPTESNWIVDVVKEVSSQYTVDPQRIVAHGMGTGGQMAYHLGLNYRNIFRGVATMGAVFTEHPRDNVANQRLSFFIASGDKDPLHEAVVQSVTKLTERKFPVVQRQIKNVGAQYYDEKTFKEVVRWIDALDRE